MGDEEEESTLQSWERLPAPRAGMCTSSPFAFTAWRAGLPVALPDPSPVMNFSRLASEWLGGEDCGRCLWEPPLEPPLWVPRPRDAPPRCPIVVAGISRTLRFRTGSPRSRSRSRYSWAMRSSSESPVCSITEEGLSRLSSTPPPAGGSKRRTALREAAPTGGSDLDETPPPPDRLLSAPRRVLPGPVSRRVG